MRTPKYILTESSPQETDLDHPKPILVLFRPLLTRSFSECGKSILIQFAPCSDSVFVVSSQDLSASVVLNNRTNACSQFWSPHPGIGKALFPRRQRWPKDGGRLARASLEMGEGSFLHPKLVNYQLLRLTWVSARVCALVVCSLRGCKPPTSKHIFITYSSTVRKT